MIKVRDEKDQVNIAKVHEAGQEHVLRFWDELDARQRRALLDQIDDIDFQRLGQLARSIGDKPRLKHLEPPPGVVRMAAGPEDRERDARSAEAGAEALARGRVAGVIVAGGQGTRLGFDGPKGTFPIGPVTDRSLFKVFAEKALAAARRYRSSFPLYIMTSPLNDAAIQAFWKEHDHFGMSAADVFFFKQRQQPAMTRRGKLLLAEKGRIATSPNGHGGVFDALLRRGALDDMARRNLELVSYWQVDNPLVKVADPTFLGDLLVRNAEAGAKVAPKRSPDEKVGVFAHIDGKLGVVEYSELSEEEAARRDDGGRLRFDAGNVAIHAFRRSFLERIANDEHALPFHQAHKKVPHIGRDGERVEPDEPNAIKFELFIFDAFGAAEGVVLREIDRREEFAPVKNACGDDSPATARQALSDRYAGWLEAAGAKVARGADGHAACPIEISALVAEGPNELERKIEQGQAIEEPFVLSA